MALPLYALGARGTKPVFFPGLTAAQIEAATQIPGAWLVPGGLSCSWDAAAAVAAAVNRAVPPAPSFQIGMPGLARYRERKLHELARPYQKVGAAFVAMRAESMLCHTMRAGKCLMFTAASILVDAKRTLVITPALVRLTWQDEILKWAGQPVVILEGRGACEAKFVCLTCRGKGRLANESWCPDCRAANGSSYGYRKFAPTYPEEWSGTTKVDGKRVSRFEVLSEVQQRAVYDDVQRRRAAVREQIRAEILRLPYCYAILSYDLFLAQRATDLRGRGLVREDLPGWGPFLSSITWDMAACDESHRLRGFGTDENRRGQSRRERVRDALAGVPQVCLITATPIFSYTRDLWGQLDVLTNGGWGKTPFSLHVRYAGGGKGLGYGDTWYSNGLSNVAELQSRLFPHIMIKPSREEILPDMPPIIREIVHLDEADIPALPGGIEVVRAGDELDDEGERKNTVKRALADAGYAKIPAVVESVLAEMAEGGKCIIFTKHVGVAQATHDVLGHVFKGREYGPVLRAQGAKAWLASGSKSPDARAKAASAFVEHNGAAVFVATIDAFQVGVSLFGARSVHFVELHYDPMAISQAEARPYDPRITRGLHVRFYVLRDSGDEAVEEIVLRKYVQVAAVTKDETAAQTTEAFRGEANPKAAANTMLAIYARIMKRIEEEM
jgi:hypothetical protein